MFDAAQIFRQTVQAGHFASLAGAETPKTAGKAVESGQAMGFNLATMEDPVASLADSMEEISMMFEEKAMKSVGQRKLGAAHGRHAAYLRAIQAWQKLLPDMPRGNVLTAFANQIKKAFDDQRKMSVDDLLAKLEEESEEPSHQFAMLDAMSQQFGEGGNREIRDLLDAARERLMQTKGEEIRSAVNLAETINAQAKDPGEIKDLRALYRDQVLGFSTPQECFKSLVATRGAGRLGEALDFLVKSCGIDLESATPSQSPEELRRILLDLQSVNVLRAVMEKFDTLGGRMTKYYGEKGLLNGEQLTGRILDLTEQPFVSKDDVSGLVNACAFAKLPSKVFFATELVGVSRSLSPRLFGEAGDRFKLVDACQEHLDALVGELVPEDKAAYESALAQMQTEEASR